MTSSLGDRGDASVGASMSPSFPRNGCIELGGCGVMLQCFGLCSLPGHLCPPRGAVRAQVLRRRAGALPPALCGAPPAGQLYGGRPAAKESRTNQREEELKSEQQEPGPVQVWRPLYSEVIT